MTRGGPVSVPPGETPHLTIGNVREELTPPRSVERSHDPRGRRLSAEEIETRRALVRVIAADPVKQQWLRDYGAALLRAAVQELEHSMNGSGADVVECRAGEHERGETALW
jgi:hypothetical protein